MRAFLRKRGDVVEENVRDYLVEAELVASISTGSEEKTAERDATKCYSGIRY